MYIYVYIYIYIYTSVSICRSNVKSHTGFYSQIKRNFKSYHIFNSLMFQIIVTLRASNIYFVFLHLGTIDNGTNLLKKKCHFSEIRRKF